MPRPNAKLFLHSTMAPSPLVLQFRLPPRTMRASLGDDLAQIDLENAHTCRFGKELASRALDADDDTMTARTGTAGPASSPTSPKS